MSLPPDGRGYARAGRMGSGVVLGGAPIAVLMAVEPMKSAVASSAMARMVRFMVVACVGLCLFTCCFAALRAVRDLGDASARERWNRRLRRWTLIAGVWYWRSIDSRGDPNGAA